MREEIMHNNLKEAHALAESVRFSGDTLRRQSDGNESHANSVRGLFCQNGLMVTKEVTPELYERLSHVCSRLHIPQQSVEAFIYASPEIQAECYSSGVTECILRMTSGLVYLLENDELDFVLGHELGHFLLGHGISKMESQQESLEFFMQQRSQELSADRMGLLACGTLDTGLKAMIKTVSGLSSKYLRLDVGTFIGQLRNASQRGSEGSTHPSMLVRCRALLWFSLDDSFIKNSRVFENDRMEKLDGQIKKDLDKYVDGLANRRIQEAKDDLAIWTAAYAVVQDGVFDKGEQAVFSKRFGSEILEKLLNFLKGLNP
jgi:hypothetical protein